MEKETWTFVGVLIWATSVLSFAFLFGIGFWTAYAIVTGNRFAAFDGFIKMMHWVGEKVLPKRKPKAEEEEEVVTSTPKKKRKTPTRKKPVNKSKKAVPTAPLAETTEETDE